MLVNSPQSKECHETGVPLATAPDAEAREEEQSWGIPGDFLLGTVLPVLVSEQGEWVVGGTDR